MENYTLVFTTGAPGSCWSMISNRLKKIMPWFDKSDEMLERKYKMPEEHASRYYNVNDPNWNQTTHNGAYFGPYHEFGQGFDNIPTNYTKDEFIKECLQPYSDDTRPNKLIRSHWFAYNLDWIWDNFKGHKMLLIWREPELAEQWWYSMGGWSIDYPIYTWYENTTKMSIQIKEESDLVLDFAKRHNIEWWDFDAEGQWLYSRFTNTKYIEPKANPMIKDNIKVAFFEIV
jgi:hypothetical protein